MNMIWVCPACHGTLTSKNDSIWCSTCNIDYPRVGNIPDLRLSGESWLDHDEDLMRARSLYALSSNLDLQSLIRTVYERQAGRDKATINLRTRQVIEAPKKCQGHVEKWLAQGLEQSDTFLDLGCGAGMLAAAAAPYAKKTIGIDVSMEWLVVAERLIREYGGKPILAAAMAEYMPLPKGAIDFVVSLDVIEHVSDQSRYLSEINRILKPGGHVALSTPNRFSLTAEPHVFVWGVGWLPRRWQKWYVNAVSGKSYENTCLMSYWGLESLIRKNTNLNISITPGIVSNIDMSRFPPLRRKLARIYNHIHRWPILRWLFRIICPFFQITGTKQ